MIEVWPVAYNEADYPEPSVREDWYAYYIFYTSNNNPLLIDCIKPLIEELRDLNLIERWFFIRYWLEGPHLRLRIKPRPESYDRVKCIVNERVIAFLKVRPALYEVKSEIVGDIYKDMFLMEGSEEEWNELYGDDGMPIRPSNSTSVEVYEPEYIKYGGPNGVEISEQHFEDSSDLVLSLLDETNAHVRSVLFGLALQIMFVTIGTFFPDRGDQLEFLKAYQSFWSTIAQQNSKTDEYENNFMQMGERLYQQIVGMSELVACDRQEELPSFLSDWGVKVRRTREQLDEATRESKILLMSRESGARNVADDENKVRRSLLVPYIHMTNNRIGISIPEEIYLSYLLQRHLEAWP